ncbi:divergent protein kinase domain 2A isoform X2 [Zophobas morio]|uniref:divergent protein kinase domain 2A isoform X2 n=1 Tax=Zophobas morio TaxID=2755281 RepID=UPI003083CCF6
MNFALIVLVISTIAGIYIGILSQRPVSSLSDSIKCPFCYGIDLCKDVDDKRITLTYKSFGDVFYNLFSVKNLYFAEYGDKRVVLKKLGHKEELDRIRRTHVAQDDVLNFMKSDDGVRSFRPCSKETAKTFLNEMSSNFDLDQIWTILQVNVEPLILTLLSNQAWPVPKLYGRLYLTDISPDNIAVDDNFTLYFVDLENVILKQKLEDNKMIHYSEYFADEDFVYSEEEVCQSPISDHNVYAVCRLLLSRRAPWPMMRNGLLHSPPPGVTTLHSELFSLVEECVDSKVKLNRFYIAEELIRLLKGVIE